MLTGRQAFQGDTISEILASVLAREPEFGVIPKDVNPRLLDLLRRCLQKNPKRRWHCAADLSADLDSIAAAPRTALAIASASAPPRSLEAHDSGCRRGDCFKFHHRPCRMGVQTGNGCSGRAIFHFGYR